MSAEKVANLTGEILKGLLPDAMVVRQVTTADFDAIKTNGLYIVNPEQGFINYPPGVYGYGSLAVAIAGAFGFQLYVSDRASDPLLIRRFYSGLGWRQWGRVAVTLVE